MENRQLPPSKGSIQIALAEATNTRGTTTAIDNAIVSFNEGTTLPKFRFGDNAEIYVPQGDEDYAIVSAETQGELPLNFRAYKDGTYSLTVSTTLNSQLSTLNLIDNLTGADIDLLQTPSYTFDSKTTDYESRFKLVFEGKEDNQNNLDNNDNFAFFHNGQLVIEGTGALQVFDILGHQFLSKELSTLNSQLPPSPACMCCV